MNGTEDTVSNVVIHSQNKVKLPVGLGLSSLSNRNFNNFMPTCRILHNITETKSSACIGLVGLQQRLHLIIAAPSQLYTD